MAGYRRNYRFDSKGRPTGYTLTRTSEKLTKAQAEAIGRGLAIGLKLVGVLVGLVVLFVLGLWLFDLSVTFVAWVGDWRVHSFPSNFFAFNLWFIAKVPQVVFGVPWDWIYTRRLTPFPFINIVLYVVAIAAMIGGATTLVAELARKSDKHKEALQAIAALVLVGPALVALLSWAAMLLWWIVKLMFTTY